MWENSYLEMAHEMYAQIVQREFCKTCTKISQFAI